MAYQMAKEAALQETVFFCTNHCSSEPPNPNLPEQLVYTEEEIKWAKRLSMSQCLESWWQGKLVIPNSSGETILKKIQRVTHMGIRRTADVVRQSKVTFKSVHSRRYRDRL